MVPGGRVGRVIAEYLRRHPGPLPTHSVPGLAQHYFAKAPSQTGGNFYTSTQPLPWEHSPAQLGMPPQQQLDPGIDLPSRFSFEPAGVAACGRLPHCLML